MSEAEILASRLGSETIEKTDDGWILANGASAPVISDGAVWWTAKHFGKQEMAAHRRMLIRHLIKLAGGLQIMQIVTQLSACDFSIAPASKDVIKMDMLKLTTDGVVKRAGNSKKFVLTDDAK